MEGGAATADERCTETPLQVAVAAGHSDLVALLLSCGANAFLSTLMRDSLCYSGECLPLHPHEGLPLLLR